MLLYHCHCNHCHSHFSLTEPNPKSAIHLFSQTLARLPSPGLPVEVKVLLMSSNPDHGAEGFDARIYNQFLGPKGKSIPSEITI